MTVRMGALEPGWQSKRMKIIRVTDDSSGMTISDLILYERKISFYFM